MDLRAALREHGSRCRVMAALVKAHSPSVPPLGPAYTAGPPLPKARATQLAALHLHTWCEGTCWAPWSAWQRPHQAGCEGGGSSLMPACLRQVGHWFTPWAAPYAGGEAAQRRHPSCHSAQPCPNMDVTVITGAKPLVGCGRRQPASAGWPESCCGAAQDTCKCCVPIW